MVRGDVMGGSYQGIPPIEIKCDSTPVFFYWIDKLFAKKDCLLVTITDELRGVERIFFLTLQGISSKIKHPVIIKLFLSAYLTTYSEYHTEKKLAKTIAKSVIARLEKEGYKLEKSLE